VDNLPAGRIVQTSEFAADAAGTTFKEQTGLNIMLPRGWLWLAALTDSADATFGTWNGNAGGRLLGSATGFVAMDGMLTKGSVSYAAGLPDPAPTGLTYDSTAAQMFAMSVKEG
jgi:hypothetical protein